jgi:phytoene dehydrogenase-like protein
VKAIVIGAGHNGLVCATLLARQGMQVQVFEEKNMVGGAVKTEFPFTKAPGLGVSSGAYLLGPMPPEIITLMGADITTIRRDPHYFLPMKDGRYLMFGSNKDEMKAQFERFFSLDDWKANEALVEEIGHLRDDLAPSWMKGPLSLDDTAERYIRPKLRNVFRDLVTKPVEHYLSRFGFKSELIMAMYAVTDGFSGLCGSFGTPGTGMNFLVHNMCRLPGSDGTFMIVKGGMGSITREFARVAKLAGVHIECNAAVEQIICERGQARGVLLADGRQVVSDIVVCNADPFRMRGLVGRSHFDEDFNARLDDMMRPGTTLKLNFAMNKLPTFSCLRENRGQHNATIHLFPQSENVMEDMRRGFEQALRGELPECPTIEWYTHTQADPSLQDEHGNHNAAFFVQWAPYQLREGSWDEKQDAYAKHLLGIADGFAPGLLDSIVDYDIVPPPQIEKRFGISHGHIHHIDNTFALDKRMPYRTPVDGLYSCSAGCHPAGSVIGCAGHNAAMRVLADIVARPVQSRAMDRLGDMNHS